MGVRFFGNVTIPTLIIGAGKGRYATIYLLSANDDGTLFRQNIKDGSITWSSAIESVSPIAVDGNAYTNYSYVAYQNSTVKKIDSRGTTIWTTTVSSTPSDLSLGSNNKLYVVHNGGNLSVIDTDDGSMISTYTISDITRVSAKYGVHVGTSSGYIHYLDNEGVSQWFNNQGSSILEIINDSYGNTFSLSNVYRKIDKNGSTVWTYNSTSYGTFKSIANDPFTKSSFIGTASGNVIKLNENGQYINDYSVSTSSITALTFWYDSLYVADSSGVVAVYDENMIKQWERSPGSLGKVDLHVTQSQETIHPPIKVISKGDTIYSKVKPTISDVYEIGNVYNSEISVYENKLYSPTIDSDTSMVVLSKPTLSDVYEVSNNFVDDTTEYNDRLISPVLDTDTSMVVMSKPTLSDVYEVSNNYVSNISNYNDEQIRPVVSVDNTMSVLSKPTLSDVYETNINYI